jgi:proteasome lid subunit RPN8/RPN11
MLPLIIDPSAESVMRAHAEQDFPNECVGFFYGQDTAEGRTISLARPIINSKEGDQRRRFEVSPIDYMKAEQYALLNDLTLLGVYHSHPQHPAIPSEHDLLQALPFFSYVILSVMDGNMDHIRSWRLSEDGQFEEEFIGNTAVNTI